MSKQTDLGVPATFNKITKVQLLAALNKITKVQLLAALKILAAEGNDPEVDHQIADGLLLRYINDPKVTAAFAAIEKWYSS